MMKKQRAANSFYTRGFHSSKLKNNKLASADSESDEGANGWNKCKRVSI